MPRRPGYGQLYREGFVVNLLNPKTALFFFAFLPKFVEPGRGHVALQIAFLGLLFALLGLISDGCYALAAGTAGEWLKRSRAYLRFERYVSGGLLIALGGTAAFAGHRLKERRGGCHAGNSANRREDVTEEQEEAAWCARGN